MNGRTASPAPPSTGAPSLLDGSFRLVVAFTAILCLVLAGRFLIVAAGPVPAGPAGLTEDETTAAASPVRYDAPVAAPPLPLTDQDGRPFSLDADRGVPVFVFFGYTHCADVCPATVGILGQVLAGYGRDARAVFVSVDPERDTVAWLHEYVRYLQAGFSGLTGSPSEIRSVADAWGVRYARVDGDVPGEYSMAHTADVFLVDAGGLLRARFPFGTDVPTMLGVLRDVEANPVPTPASGPPAATSTAATTATAEPTGAAIAELDVEVVSTAVWAGQPSPVIVRLADESGATLPDDAAVTIQPTSAARAPVGPPVVAIPIHQDGVDVTSWVAVVDIPNSGWAGLAVTARLTIGLAAGTATVSTLDPGGTAPLGAPAPTVRTPTLADVGGRTLEVTTDPLPDLRLSRTSTADALAAGEPFVLIVDSRRFQVTAVCGTALALAKYLVDRWTDMTFIHLEPWRYHVITDTAVLEGSLANPSIVPAADAWGVASPPWGATSMPWVFVVDRHGIVRAKYQGIVGSADIDVILSMLAAEG